MPHHLKYALAHSGTTLARPSRAKRRTSSKISHGLRSRLRRSMRWALDSFTGTAGAVRVSVITFELSSNEVEIKNPPAEGGFESAARLNRDQRQVRLGAEQQQAEFMTILITSNDNCRRASPQAPISRELGCGEFDMAREKSDDGYRLRTLVQRRAKTSMHRTRREVLAGLGFATLAATTSPLIQAESHTCPFRLAVINDEITQDFERACQITSHDFGLDWIELRAMWNKNVTELNDKEGAEGNKILAEHKLRVTDIASPLFKTDWPGAPISKQSERRDQFHASFDAEAQNRLLHRCIELAKTFKTNPIRGF